MGLLNLRLMIRIWRVEWMNGWGRWHCLWHLAFAFDTQTLQDGAMALVLRGSLHRTGVQATVTLLNDRKSHSSTQLPYHFQSLL